MKLCFVLVIVLFLLHSRPLLAEQHIDENTVEQNKEYFYLKESSVLNLYTGQLNFFYKDANVLCKQGYDVGLALGYSYSPNFKDCFDTEIEINKSVFTPSFQNLTSEQQKNLITNVKQALLLQDILLSDVEEIFKVTRMSLLSNNYYRYRLHERLEIYLGSGLGASWLYNYRGQSTSHEHAIGISLKTMIGFSYQIDTRMSAQVGYNYLAGVWINREVVDWLAPGQRRYMDGTFYRFTTHGISFGVSIIL